MTALRLGLIGDNIRRSQSPRLHRLAGDLAGIGVRYDRLVPIEAGESFDDLLERCRTSGYRGVNVTYPYKERAARLVRIDDPLVRAMGTVNTVTFDADGARGTSTDYTGFVAAYRAVRGDTAPGPVLLIGAGGVGRAIAFGLVRLGARALRLVDRDAAKAEDLANAVQAIAPDVQVSIWVGAETAAAGAEGLVNCTPVGMDGHPGTPLPRAAMAGARWAFDAVYTPVKTQFLTDAAASGLAVLSGWELFFWQGVHAWRLFSGHEVDAAALRRALSEGAPVG